MSRRPPARSIRRALERAVLYGAPNEWCMFVCSVPLRRACTLNGASEQRDYDVMRAMVGNSAAIKRARAVGDAFRAAFSR